MCVTSVPARQRDVLAGGAGGGTPDHEGASSPTVSPSGDERGSAATRVRSGATALIANRAASPVITSSVSLVVKARSPISLTGAPCPRRAAGSGCCAIVGPGLTALLMGPRPRDRHAQRHAGPWSDPSASSTALAPFRPRVDRWLPRRRAAGACAPVTQPTRRWCGRDPRGPSSCLTTFQRDFPR